MADESAREKAARIKMLMQGYYDISPPPESGPAGASGANGDTSPSPADEPYPSAPTPFSRGPDYSAALDLDSSDFNPELYFRKVVGGQSLEEVMQTHANVARGVQELDSSMQTLVYDNYSKFIEATNTIKTMKSDVQELEPDKQQLKELVARVAEHSQSINTTLQKRRQEIEDLGSIRSLLQKLGSVFELPEQLEQLLAGGDVEAAVARFARASVLLNTYGHRGPLRSVRERCQRQMDGVVQQLQERIQQPGVSPEETQRAVGLLSQLGQDAGQLQSVFLNSCSLQLTTVLAHALLVASDMARACGLLPLAGRSLSGAAAPVLEEALPPAQLAEAREQLREAEWGYASPSEPPALGTFVRILNEKFINTATQAVCQFQDTFGPQDVGAAGTAAAQQQQRLSLKAALRSVVAAFFSLVRKVLQDAACVLAKSAAGVTSPPPNAPPGSPGRAAGHTPETLPKDGASPHIDFDWGAHSMADALQHIAIDVARLHPLLPDLAIKDKTEELVEWTVRYHVGVSMAALERRVLMGVEVAAAKLQSCSLPAAEAAADAADDADGAEADARREREQRELERARSGAMTGAELLLSFTGLSNLLLKGITAVLRGMQMYLSHARLLASWQDLFVDLVQASLQQLMLSLLVRWQLLGSCPQPSERQPALTPLLPSICLSALDSAHAATPPLFPPEPDTAAPPPPGVILLVAKLCLFMESSAVPEAMLAIASTFPSQGGAGGAGRPPPFIGGQLQRQMLAASAALTSSYVAVWGRAVSATVQDSMSCADWGREATPLRPRRICHLLMDRLRHAEVEVVQLVDDGGHQRSAGPAKAGSGHHHRRTSSVSGAAGALDLHLAPTESGGASMMLSLQQDVSSIFMDRARIFGEVEFTQTGILSAIACFGLKAWVEYVRLRNLGRGALQQLQVDTAYLRPQLHALLASRDAPGPDALLDEIVAAGKDRCMDPPQLLTAPILNRVLARSNPGELQDDDAVDPGGPCPAEEASVVV